MSTISGYRRKAVAERTNKKPKIFEALMAHKGKVFLIK